VLVLAMGLWCVPDWGFLTSEITHYHVYCSVEARDAEGDCPEVEFVFPRTIYTVDAAKQEVFARTDGVGEKRRKTGCTVIDRSNWKCMMEDTRPASEFGFRQGRYFEREHADGLPEKIDRSGAYVTIPKWRYLALKFGLEKTLLRDVRAVY
jgi:hypothetical protein